MFLSVACSMALVSGLSAQIESVGEYNYIAYQQNLVKTLSNPSNQVVQGELQVTRSVEKIWGSDFQGDYAYYSTLTDDSFHVVDMSGSTPSEVGNLRDPDRFISAITVVGDYAYVASYEPVTFNKDYALKVLYVAEASNPQPLGTLNLGEIGGGNVIGGISIEGNYAYIAIDGEGVKIVNIADKSNPQLVGTIASSAQGVTVVGEYVYITEVNGFKIVNISDINNPIEVSNYSDSRSVYESRILVDGDYAYYTTGTNFTIGNEITIVNISDKTNPQSVGTYLLNEEGTAFSDYINIEDIAINGDYLYIQKYKSGNEDNLYAHLEEGVITVDISDKLNPTFVEPKTVESFVKRFYSVVLGRDADAAGLESWVGQLVSGESAGEDIARGFIFSGEFTGQAKSNEDFVKVLYQAFFNREADSAGLEGWTTQLNGGTSKEDVLDGFLYSIEFANLAREYGIKPTRDSQTPGGHPQVEAFVERFYTVILGRTADDAGLQSWVNQLVSHQSAGSDIARGFIFSEEFTGQEKNNENFVKVLYQAFFDREADSAGLEGWAAQLNSGISREDVLNGFLYSAEFANLAESYGILEVPGAVPPPAPTSSNLASLIVGKTYYVTAEDTNNNHVETLFFAGDELLHISWVENGTEHTRTLGYTFTQNNVLVVETDSSSGDIEFLNVQQHSDHLSFTNSAGEEAGRFFFTFAAAEAALP